MSDDTTPKLPSITTVFPTPEEFNRTLDNLRAATNLRFKGIDVNDSVFAQNQAEVNITSDAPKKMGPFYSEDYVATPVPGTVNLDGFKIDVSAPELSRFLSTTSDQLSVNTGNVSITTNNASGLIVSSGISQWAAADIRNDLNRIVAAANRYPNGFMAVGVRHCDAIMGAQILAAGIEPVGANEIQGFLDSKGQFHTREQAWVIAMAAGQVIKRVSGDGNKLFSENIY